MSKACFEAERRVLRLLHGYKTRTQLPQIHGYSVRHGLDQSNQVLAHFVSVCGALDKMAYANRIFRETLNPNITLINSMIKGYSLCGPFEQSLHLFSLLKSRGIRPDEYTFAPLLKSCSNLCDFKLGQCVHAELIRIGFECFASIQIAIVELYVTCERMEDAKTLFDGMSYRDVVVWNLIIRGFCKTGKIDMGLYLFRQMTERSIVSWNSMISCLAQGGRDSEALKLFSEMWNQGFEPDEATVVIVLPVCARLGAIGVGHRIDSYSGSRGFMQDVISVGNSLIDFYCKCGNLEIAWNIFNEMPVKNVVSWNAMISGLAFNGKGEAGVNLFEEMMNKGVNPNAATFVGVLACCTHSGLVERGREFFSSMKSNHQIHPQLEHYGCMVDLLGRNGCVREAHALIRSMTMKPNALLWGSLLSACRTYARGPPVQRNPLKHRDYEVDLESRLGKTQVVTPVAPLSQQAGYFCSVCDCVVKDSANYLDHINGKKHQRALGMSMRVERASVEQVKERFEVLKKRRVPGSFTEQDLDDRILKQQQEEEERKRQRREKKKDKKEKAAEEEIEMDPDIAAMMGFGGFTSKKS